MKTQFHLPAFVLFVFLAGCDQTTASTSPSATVAIAPRLLAISLHSQRVAVALLHGRDTAAYLDTTYVSGRHLVLGHIPVGDSFAIVAEGYDITTSGNQPRTWWAAVRGKAGGSTTSIQSVDVPVDTATTLGADTSGSSLKLPAGAYYTTDGSDPRSSDTGGALHYTDGTARVSKTGIVKFSVLEAASVDSIGVWSRVQTFDYSGSSTAKAPTWLWGGWWEDDTLGTERFVYRVRFYPDSTYSYAQYNDTTMVATSTTDTGTLVADSTHILYASIHPSTDAVDCGLHLFSGILRTSYTDGLHGILTKTQPTKTASGTPTDTLHDATTMASLSGTWWFDTVVVNASQEAIPYQVRYRLNSDGSFDRTYFFTPADSASDPSTLAWTAGRSTLVLTINDTAHRFPIQLTGSTLALLDGSKDSLTRARPSLGNSALVGSWVASSTYAITLNADGTCLWTYGGTEYPYTWSERNGKLCFYYLGTLEYVYDYSISGKTLTLDGDSYVKS